MKTKLMVVTTIAFGAMALAVSAMTDAEMRKRIEGSAYIFDDPSASDAELRYVLRCCEYDTNRFLSAMQAVAVEKPKLSDYICQELGKYGNASCLPFLYQNMTNSAARSYAASSMLKIEGLTSNSIERMGMYLLGPGGHHRDKTYVCGEMLSLAAAGGITNALGVLSVEKALQYASTGNPYVQQLDEDICRYNPAYVMSKRRLSVLRAAVERGIHRNQIAYVTNAINELVSYPEADLPD